MSIRQYISNHWKLVIIIPVLTLLSYGFFVFSGNVRYDTDILMITPGTDMGWSDLGRYGMVFIQKMFGLDVYSYVYFGILFYIFYVLAIELLVYFIYDVSGFDEKYKYWIFVMLYVTSPIFLFQLYFTLQEAEIGIGYFLIVIASYIAIKVYFEPSLKKVIIGTPALLVLQIIGFGIYQAFVIYYISLITVFLLLKFELYNQAYQYKKAFKSLIFIIVEFLASYIIFYLISSFYSSGDYISEQIHWGNESVAVCITTILFCIIKMVLVSATMRMSCLIVACMLVVYLFVLVLNKKTHNTKIGGWIWIKYLSIVFAFISPFLMVLYEGGEPVPRANLSLPLMAPFLVMYLLKIIGRYIDCRKERVLERLVIIISLVFFAIQLVSCFRITYTDNARYKKDIELMNQLVKDVDECVSDKLKPVFWVGGVSYDYGRFAVCEDMIGLSMFNGMEDVPYLASQRTNVFLEVHGYNMGDPGIFADEPYEIRPVADTMPSYPDKGSIYEGNEWVIIKLSNLFDGTRLE